VSKEQERETAGHSEINATRRPIAVFISPLSGKSSDVSMRAAHQRHKCPLFTGPGGTPKQGRRGRRDHELR
jgi:hypothetical protein